ncbi:MAG: hypothetical protein M1820_007387 [Bogoriella megaspora]|nr:MAG: hypothetical protein M1820_007387 [Bogoriella megaspora]
MSMPIMKTIGAAEDGAVRHRPTETNALAAELKSTDHDTRALAKHGKRQQLNRTFGFISAVAFSSILLTSWEAIAVTIENGFENGGPVALIYGLILSWIGTMTLCLSLAEMASMAPLASAQYHWAAMFTRASGSHLPSWVAGWLTVFAWQANIASVGYLIARQIQGIVVLNHESYTPERWHGTLIFWAVVVVSTCVNVFGIKILPQLEILAGVLHICLWFVWLVPLVYLLPQRSASWVFTDFENNSGWKSDGVSWCLGLLTVTYPFIGFEGVCHISEEIENAAMTVPRSMVLSLAINGLLGFGFLIGLLFSTTDIEAAMKSPTGSPIIQLLYDAVQSKSATSAVVSLFLVLGLCGEMGMIASTSRLTWSFARDNGLPLSRIFARVNRAYGIPINAILLNATVAMLLNLIYIASPTAFSAIISLTTLSLYCSYVFPIVILVFWRVKGRAPPTGPFNLGRFGLVINILGILWGVFTIIFVILPKEMPVTAENMNYAPAVFGAALVLSLSLWFLYGKKVYRGPINETGEEAILLE